jgi:hypothetical protein
MAKRKLRLQWEKRMAQMAVLELAAMFVPIFVPFPGLGVMFMLGWLGVAIKFILEP